jgi:hypothetical protein
MQSTSKLSEKKRTAALRTVTLLSPGTLPAASVAAIFLRHAKFPDFYQRSHHHTARIDSPADIGARWLADGSS